MTLDLTVFPDRFLWGASVAAHQVEGNNVLSDFWQAEHDGSWGLEDRSGDACDSYHRWEEDLDLVQELGLNSYRFSLEWARIMPTPEHPSRAELAHYRRIITACLARDITPVVTLHHFTNPVWLRHEGGWKSTRAVRHFARYVSEVLPILDGVAWVCTINEPNMLSLMTARHNQHQENSRKGHLPRPDPQVTQALIDAHHAAQDLLSDLPGVKTGWTVANQNVQDHGAGPARTAEISRIIDDTYLDVAKEDDFVGVQAYSRLRVGSEGIAWPNDQDRRTMIGWEFYPQALEDAIRHTATRVGDGTAILVTENGIATEDDDERIEYTEQALLGLQRALCDGIDVRGYLHWSLLDNFEWGSWRPKFGLVSVDRDTFQRTIKPSARWYADVVARAATPGLAPAR